MLQSTGFDRSAHDVKIYEGPRRSASLNNMLRNARQHADEAHNVHKDKSEQYTAQQDPHLHKANVSVAIR